MNTQTHRLIFNKSRGCMMAVAETASSSSKSPSGTSKAHRRSSKCSKSAKSDGFTLANKPPAQWIRAQTAPDLIVFDFNSQTINNTNAGFTYAVYDVAGAGDTVYGTAGGAFYESQGAVPSAPLAYYRQAGTGVQTYTLNPAAGQGWAGGYLIYNAVQYSTTEQRAVVTSTAPGVISRERRGQVFHYDILLKNAMFRPLRLKPARAPYQVQSNVAI